VTFVCLEWPNGKHVGGVGRYAYRIAVAISALVDLTVVTIRGGEAIPGVRMVYVRPPRSRVDRFYVIPFLLRKTVGAISSDVVHAFGDDWALAGATPVVRTFLGSSLGEARASTGLRKLNHYVLALTEAISRKKATYKIAIGADSNAEFRCDTVMPPVVAVARPPGVTKTEAPSVIFIGSFNGRKRGELVERVVARVSAEIGRDVSLTVVGPKTDAFNWAPETLHLAGADDDTVASVVASSWVLMAPSLYEGFGIPAFEALSLQTAVIASSNPGSEFVKSFAKSAESLKLVNDADLGKALAERIHRGANLTSSELVETRNAVQGILHAADPGRLVRDVYMMIATERSAS
jgi:glycosyltransferase involved in cell wall biosynthesis